MTKVVYQFLIVVLSASFFLLPMARANGEAQVQLSESSHSHLDDNTSFGTLNSARVYAVSPGSANHDPGPITKSLLKDLGWAQAGGSLPTVIPMLTPTRMSIIQSTGSISTFLPLVVRPDSSLPPGSFSKSSPANGAASQPANPVLSWGSSSDATSYEYCLDTSNDNTCNTNWVSTAGSTSAGLTGLVPGTSYFWQVRAKNTAGLTRANAGAWWSFATAQDPFAIPNGGFELGAASGWTSSSSHDWTLIGTADALAYSEDTPRVEPYVGNYMARLGGSGYEISRLYQTVTFPNVTPLYLSTDWQLRGGAGTECNPLYGGALYLEVNGQKLWDTYICEYVATGVWHRASDNVSALAGQTVTIEYRVEAPDFLWTFLYLDDITLSQTP